MAILAATGPVPQETRPKPGRRVSFANVDTIPTSPRNDNGRLEKSDHDETTTASTTNAMGSRAEDPDPWSHKFILCLDGGGVRGYSTLMILQTLMEKIKEEERRIAPKALSSAFPYALAMDDNLFGSTSRTGSLHSNFSWESRGSTNTSDYLPCHYFDYIAGTSTGGLIAIMLSRLRMSVDKCISHYTHMGPAIFRTKRFRIPPPLNPGSMKKYTKRLEMMLKTLVEERRSKASIDEEGHFVSHSECSRTIVVTIREGSTSSAPYIFRSYERSPRQKGSTFRYTDQSLECKIWEIARATTAAPSYFKPMKIKDQRFVDGGLAANNPSWLVLNEIEEIEGSKDAIEFFLSVGTGVAPTSLSPKTTKSMAKSRKQLLATSQESDLHISRPQEPSEKPLYERWDVSDSDDANIKSLEPKLWRNDYTYQFIKDATDRYLQNSEVTEALQRTARLLVKRRRQRAHTPKWESFVFGVAYICNSEEGDSSPDCSTTKVFKDRNELIRHMQTKHNWNSPGPDNAGKYEKLLNDCRVKVDRNSGELLVGARNGQ